MWSDGQVTNQRHLDAIADAEFSAYWLDYGFYPFDYISSHNIAHK